MTELEEPMAWGEAVGRAWAVGLADSFMRSRASLLAGIEAIRQELADAYLREFAAQRELVDYLATVPRWSQLRARWRLR